MVIPRPWQRVAQTILSWDTAPTRRRLDSVAVHGFGVMVEVVPNRRKRALEASALAWPRRIAFVSSLGP